MTRSCIYGVLYTPRQLSLAREMEKIHIAAEARSDNPCFWDYTPEELEELHRLSVEYRKEAHAND